MTSINHDQRNQILDDIIIERRSYRQFTDDLVPDEHVMNIITAGLHAPYAGAAISGNDEFRRFFVIRKNSKTMQVIQRLLFHEMEEMALNLEKAAVHNGDLAKQAGGFIKRLAMMKKMGIIPGIGTAPIFLVVAEKKGFPPVEQVSLAHCLENMWLKATTLDLGFQLVSITSQMDNIAEFCQVFDLKPGEWGFMGCAIGYPVEKLPGSVRPDAKDVTTWLS